MTTYLATYNNIKLSYQIKVTYLNMRFLLWVVVNMASVGLSEETKERLDEYCERNSKVKARVAEKAINEYLDNKGGDE